MQRGIDQLVRGRLCKADGKCNPVRLPCEVIRDEDIFEQLTLGIFDQPSSRN